MKLKSINWKAVIIGGVFFGGMIALIWYNIANNTAFWNTSITTCLTLAISVVVSYYLVQYRLDKRKQKDILIQILTDIQKIVNAPDAWCIEIDTPQISLTMRNRELNNKLGILKQWKDKFNIKEEIEFIEKEIGEYEGIIGNHIDDMEHLHKSAKELQRPLDLINDKAYEIMLKIYE